MENEDWQKQINQRVVSAGPGMVLIWFLIASALIATVAYFAGFYSYSVDDEAHINMEYRPPAGDRRY